MTIKPISDWSVSINYEKPNKDQRSCQHFSLINSFDLMVILTGGAALTLFVFSQTFKYMQIFTPSPILYFRFFRRHCLWCCVHSHL